MISAFGILISFCFHFGFEIELLILIVTAVNGLDGEERGEDIINGIVWLESGS